MDALIFIILAPYPAGTRMFQPKPNLKHTFTNTLHEHLRSMASLNNLKFSLLHSPRLGIYPSTSSSGSPPSLLPLPIKPHTIPPSVISRRLFLPSVSGIWDALTGGGGNNNSREAVLAIRRGMLLLRQVQRSFFYFISWLSYPNASSYLNFVSICIY